MGIEFKAILEAFELVSFGSMYEHQAFLDRSTGKIFYHSEYGDEMEELPENIDDEQFIEIPHKNELDLGRTWYLNLPISIFRMKWAGYRPCLTGRGPIQNIRRSLSKKICWNNGMNLNRKSKRRP